uniref:Treble clef zinc finger domain-containing protein n=1 Tax=uncultured marine group II/III euryarchaeote AD1000_96_B04 TaxID=1457829 RepID=A0A075G143_9EURY|nr:hypothetical protein [uncultured marine group II/III euryarchaeote AD1000_96_B04]
MARKYPPITSSHPEIASEWMSERNSPMGLGNISQGSQKRAWWKCADCENEWETQVSNRIRHGCPYCNSGALHSDGRNSLKEEFFEISMQWHPTRNNGLLPSEVVPGSPRKVWWLCDRSECEHLHEWEASIANRTSLGTRCPFCYGNHSFCPCNSIASTNPELAAQLHPDEPIPATELSHGSAQVVRWLCPKSECEHEHSWYSTVSNRTKGQGCPYCSNPPKTVCKCNSFGTIFPEKAAQWHPTKNGDLSPFDFTPHSSSKKVWWKCPNGPDHEWRGNISDRTRKDQHGGCPYCSKPAKMISITNCLETLYPEVARLWHPELNGELTPRDVFAGSGKRVWWKCPNGPDHEWRGPIGRLTGTEGKYESNGCPFCQGYQTSVTNRLDIHRPELVEEWHPTKNGQKTPEEFTVRSNLSVWWKCKGCGEEWRSIIGNRSKGQGCASCATYGFDPSRPAYYYAMEIHGQEGIWWYKGGISVNPETRRYMVERSLTSAGLPLEVRLVATKHFDKGRDAKRFERTLLEIEEIRAETIEKFDGSAELFEVNPLDYAVENELVENSSSQMTLDNFLLET